MCGGAIVSDFIPTARSRRVTDADLLWANLKKGGSKKKRGSRRCAVEETEDDFEADFQEFDNESGKSEENDEAELVDVQFSAFPPKGRSVLERTCVPIFFLFVSMKKNRILFTF